MRHDGKYNMVMSITALLFCALVSPALMAKGMEEIKPDPETNAEDTQEKDQDGKTEAVPEKPVPKAPAGEQPDATIEQPMVKSELSKKLDENLYLSWILGLGTLSKSGDQWGSGMNTQLMVGYFLPVAVAGYPLSAHYRYNAFDVAPKVDSRSYRGVVESHMFGATGWMRRPNGMAILAGAELGMFLAHNVKQDPYPKDEEVDDSGFGLALFGGANWRFLEKIDFGPRLRLAFGTFTQVEASAAASFVF